MNIEDSKDIDNAIQSAYHEVYTETTDLKLQCKLLDKFYDLIDATVFSDGENELDFEAGIALGAKYIQGGSQGKIYRSSYDGQSFYLVGTEEEIIKRIDTIFDCCCSTETLLRSGCKCNGN